MSGPRDLNVFLTSLVAECRAHPFDEKWLLAPSRRVGHQWLEHLARAGHAAVNVRLTTAAGLALSLAADEMAARGVRLVPRAAALVIVDRVWTALRPPGGGYLHALEPTAGLLDMIRAAIEALRLAGVPASRLGGGGLEVPRKGREIAAALEAYVRALEEAGLVDYAACLAMATARLRRDPASWSAQARLLIGADARLLPAEEDLVAAVPAARVVRLAVDDPAALPPGAAPADSMLLRWVFAPGRAPAPAGDGTADLFHATGAANEVREVLRRILAEGRRLDEVELLYSDADAYVPAVCEVLAARAASDGPGAGALPATFAEGIPAARARPARALVEWLRWIDDGFPQARLVDMLRGGLVAVPGVERAADLLAGIGIGFGLERYLAKHAEEIAARGGPERPGAGEGDIDGTGRRRARAGPGDRGRLEALRAWAARLVALSSGRAPPARALATAREFLAGVARVADELDGLAREALVEDIDEMGALLVDGGGAVSTGVDRWLTELVASRRVGGSGPRPGRLHVAHLRAGGHSGRPRTFVVGLDDARVPGGGTQDPLLLDHERAALSDRLPTARDRLSRTIGDFEALLARLRGRVTLSFSSRDLVDDRDAFPSQAVVGAHRILSGARDADQADTMASLGAPASFAPADPERCLDENEWWLWRLTGAAPARDAPALVEGRFAHLARGRRAAEARAGDAFTVWDGLVPDPDAALDPCARAGPVMSASALEQLGRCPRRYFYAHVLRVEPSPDVGVDPTRWLDHAEFGSLLHELFRRFLASLGASGARPSAARDAKGLAAMLDEVVGAWRAASPPPAESVFRAQYAELRRAARIFLVEEEALGAACRPWCLEASIGMASEAEATPLDTEAPATIALGHGRTLRARGRIDRVDVLGDPAAKVYGIWDYKTGGARSFDADDPFERGRVVQHALYVAMLQARLRAVVSPEARVAQFGYFYPGPRGGGERRVFAAEALAGGTAVIDLLCRIASAGAFSATDDSSDCSSCDYVALCGDVEEVAARAGAKLAHAANGMLAPLRALRCTDGEEEARGAREDA